MRKRYSSALLFFVSALLLGFGFRYFRRLGIGTVRAAATIPEYTVTLAERLTTGPGNFMVQHGAAPLVNVVATRRVHAARADGSRTNVVFTYALPGSNTKPVEEHRIYDFTARQKIWFVPTVHARSTSELTDSAISKMLADSDPSTGCVANSVRKLVRSDQIDGHPALVLADPRGSIWWVLPEFNCLLVHRTNDFQHAGQMESRSELDVENIAIGRPDAALFQAAGDEIRPSEMRNRIDVYEGLSAAVIAQQALPASADAEWLTYHSKK